MLAGSVITLVISIVVGCFMVIIPVAILWFFGRMLYRGSQLAQESSDWPSETGTMIQCQMVAQYRSGYSVMVLYEYEVAGQTYRHNVLAYGSHSLKTLMDKQTFVAEHPPGTPITVYYKPSAPQTAALFTGPYPTWIFALLVGLLVVMLPAFLVPVLIAIVALIGMLVGLGVN